MTADQLHQKDNMIHSLEQQLSQNGLELAQLK